jgi:DNA-binding NarL/FixJ family response regulator
VNRARLLVVAAPVDEKGLQARARRLREQGFAVVGPEASKKDVPLTRRQIQVLRGIAMGRSTTEIAYELKVSGKTVETHRMLLMKRLRIHRIAELVRYALRRGVLPASWLLD